MLKKFSPHNAGLAILSGVLLFLAFERFNIVPLIFLFPIFFNVLCFRVETNRRAFHYGFLTSFIIMLGGFYWVTYVLHEFGYVPWWIAVLLFLAFCGFGALNFPVFSLLSSALSRKIHWTKRSSFFTGVWFTLALPALFTIIEYVIPKLFPWYLGHCLYKVPQLIQIVELTGSSFLTFMIYSAGSTLGLLFFPPFQLKKRPWIFASIPILLILISYTFSQMRLTEPEIEGRTLHVALIQANVGSMEKMQSETGGGSLVDQIIRRYQKLTDEAVKSHPPPDLILWPETAMPFSMNTNERRSQQIKTLVTGWNIPLLTGAYGQSPYHVNRDYNGAFLLDPQADGSVKIQSYMKNILLAFGEYLPLGAYIPKMYSLFPQIADFERGKNQDPLFLKDGTALGITICYEAIVPAFFAKTAAHPIHAVVNLTNDSWFGPTAEPYLHGSLTIFRAIESRLPLFRVTNTGISFAVDTLGRRSKTTALFEPGFLRADLKIPKTPPRTFYMEYGDWFIVLLIVFFNSVLFFALRRPRAPISH